MRHTCQCHSAHFHARSKMQPLPDAPHVPVPLYPLPRAEQDAATGCVTRASATLPTSTCGARCSHWVRHTCQCHSTHFHVLSAVPPPNAPHASPSLYTLYLDR
eukprot:NODE_4898_length_1833_cov_6.309496.p5 GENE.NODE_4898_length_1833_cov_6.309496~~NODE_4898_length_1833_cov_6.309496.p5  ORF type:complete len:103 (-),score=16.04 NODE_4898_length_1833_cov_6.309496:429-737(-)